MENNFYEKFHENSKVQRHIVDSNNFTYRPLFTCINKFLPTRGKVLDIGCGTGSISLYLSKFNLNVVGLDISRKAISVANLNKKKFNIKNISFKNMSFEKYRSSSNFDLIVCFDLLEHVNDDKSTLIHIHNLLKNGSTLFLSVPSLNAPLYRIKLLKNFDEKVGHLRRYSENNLATLLHESKFRIVKVCKREGLLRNLLFTNDWIGKSIKIVKLPILNKIFCFIDEILLKFFGESQLIFVAIKK